MSIVLLASTLHVMFCGCTPVDMVKAYSKQVQLAQNDAGNASSGTLEGTIGGGWEMVVIGFCCGLNLLHWLGNTSHQSEDGICVLLFHNARYLPELFTESLVALLRSDGRILWCSAGYCTESLHYDS